MKYGEGNYFIHADGSKQVQDQDQILFRYCDESGSVNPSSNPNVSIDHIAGICNTTRNIFGMMPHPERAADAVLGNTDGLAIFESILKMVSAS